MSGEPPRLEDRYDLGEELGRGAFGRVVLARPRGRGDPVAVKIHAHLPSGDEDARVAREARLLRGVAHPALVPLLDHLETRAGEHALVYAFVPGEPLAAHIKAGPWDVARALGLARDLAGALGALHEEGLVHRDVKPGNVMIRADGAAVLLDYGLARPVAAGATLTADGVVLGTPSYIAPEQVTGARVGPAADQYALACLLFRVLAGRPPFGGEVGEVLIAHARAPRPALREARPDLPASLGRALSRAMAIDPGARFPAVGEFATALAAGANDPEVDAAATVVMDGAPSPVAPTPTARPPPPTRPPAARRGGGGVLVVAGGLLLAGALALRPAAAPEPAPSRLPEPAPAPRGPTRWVVLPAAAGDGAGLALVTPPDLPPPAALRFENPRIRDRATAAALPGDPRVFPVPRRLLGGFPRDPDGTLVPPPPLRAYPEGGDPSSPLAELPGEVRVFESPCEARSDEDLRLNQGPFPLTGDRALAADRQGTLFLFGPGEVRILATKGDIGDDRATPYVMSAGPDRFRIRPEGRTRGSVVEFPPPPAPPVPWDLGPAYRCPGGAEPLGALLELPRDPGQVVPLNDVGLTRTLDGEAWALARQVNGGRVEVLHARPGEEARWARPPRVFPRMVLLEHPLFPAGGGLVATWEEGEAPGEFEPSWILAAVPGEARFAWTLRLPRRPQAPPAPGPEGGLLVLAEGILRLLPREVLAGEVDLEDPRGRVLLDLGDASLDPRERDWVGWIHSDPRHGLHVLHWPGREVLARVIADSFDPRVLTSKEVHHLEWHHLPDLAAPPPDPAPRILGYGSPRVGDHRKVGIHGARPVPGTSLWLLAVMDEDDQPWLVVLDLATRSKLAEVHMGSATPGIPRHPLRTPEIFPPAGDRPGVRIAAADQRGRAYLWRAPVGTLEGVRLPQERDPLAGPQ